MEVNVMSLYRMLEQKVKLAESEIALEKLKMFPNKSKISYWEGVIKTCDDVKDFAVIKPTENQLITIKHIENNLGVEFTGATKTEAYIFIDKYIEESKRVAYENHS